MGMTWPLTWQQGTWFALRRSQWQSMLFYSHALAGLQLTQHSNAGCCQCPGFGLMLLNIWSICCGCRDEMPLVVSTAVSTCLQPAWLLSAVLEHTVWAPISHGPACSGSIAGAGLFAERIPGCSSQQVHDPSYLVSQENLSLLCSSAAH